MLDVGRLRRIFADLSRCKEQSKAYIWTLCVHVSPSYSFCCGKTSWQNRRIIIWCCLFYTQAQRFVGWLLEVQTGFVLIICFAVHYQVFKQLCFPQTSCCPAEAMPALSCLPPPVLWVKPSICSVMQYQINRLCFFSKQFSFQFFLPSSCYYTQDMVLYYAFRERTRNKSKQNKNIQKSVKSSKMVLEHIQWKRDQT